MLPELQRFLSKLVPVGLVLVIGAVSASAQPAGALGTVRFAKPGGMTSGTCSQWATACELTYAISVAVSGDQIWVAAGTYKPTTSTDRNISFMLNQGVGIYGGFAGTETSLGQRDPKANVTVLSGDIANVDISEDNSIHVVLARNADNAVLDGFTITRAWTFTSYWTSAGGMDIRGGSPTLANLIFSLNYAASGGGLATTAWSNPTLTNVTFVGNAAVDQYGGGMFLLDSHATLTNVTFVGNHAANYGGGLQASSNSHPTLRNVTFSGNVAQAGGALGLGFMSNASLTNVTFSGNAATGCGGAVFRDAGATATLTNVVLWEDEAPLNPEICTSGKEPLDISYSIIAGGCDSIAGATCGEGNLSTDPKLGALTNNGGYTQSMALMPGSSAIDTGTNSGCPVADQRGAPRPQNLQCDIGAYELGQPRLRQLHPADGIMACLRPEIGVTLELTDLVRTGGSFDPAKVVLTLDGMDVTGAVRFFETESYPASLATLLYAPAANLAAGLHYVAFGYPSDTGTLWQTWRFTAANTECALGPGLAPAPTIPAVLPPLQPSAPSVPIMPILP